MLVWAGDSAPLPPWLEEHCTVAGLLPDRARSPADLLAAAHRARPAMVVIRPDLDAATADGLVASLKRDAYTSVIPCVVVAPSTDVTHWLDLGADEVVNGAGEAGRETARVAAALRRSARDLAAQPTTRLPGASAIDVELERRIAGGERFAACYADLDHFKEYNDRYGFREGDRVIRMVALILHDAARGLVGEQGFVGHIGGDDFFLVLPLDRAADVCQLAIEVFDCLAPLQYSEADRRAGYYFGKDRRGQLHRVPLMTLSIGATTNERRRLASAAEVGRLASEMKSFAKARPGSVFAVDRRGDEELAASLHAAAEAPTSSS